MPPRNLQKKNDDSAWLPLMIGDVSSSTPPQAKTRGPLQVINQLLARLYIYFHCY